MVSAKKSEKKAKKAGKGDSDGLLSILKGVGFAVLLLGVALYVATRSTSSSGSSESAGFPLPPDVRPRTCARDIETSGLSKATIIIPYLAEKKENILMTTRSIFHYTPDALIDEVLFISDGNKPEAVYKSELEAISPKIRIIELPERQGLIRAKMVGVENAKAEVLVFMESHCIVNRAWLEPLLVQIQKNPHTLAQPILDNVALDDLSQYSAFPTTGHWRFEWNLNLIYTTPDKLQKDGDPSSPFATPATSGGIFAIQKEFWVQLGLYDPEMYQWGGDHIEATMKVWRCGGRIELVPCSRVGHMFRHDFQRPYNVDVNRVVQNYRRLADVWLDDHRETFFKVKPEARAMSVGDLTAQHKQRKKLQCKSMAWYVEHVDVEMKWEIDQICIPGCHKSQSRDCCGSHVTPAKGRSTLPKIMDRQTFREMRKKSEVHGEL